MDQVRESEEILELSKSEKTNTDYCTVRKTKYDI